MERQDWTSYISLATFCCNATINNTTKYTPYEIVFAKIARLPSELPLKESEKLPTYKNYLADLVTRLTNIRKVANNNMYNAKLKS